MNAIDERLAVLAASPDLMRRMTRDRIGGSTLVTLRIWMHEADPRCVSCGYATRIDVAKSHPRHAELGHLIAASTYSDSNVRGGFIAGNIALMCHTCNSDANELNLSFNSSLLIPDAFVPMEWPKQRQTAKVISSEVLESRAARKW